MHVCGIAEPAPDDTVNSLYGFLVNKIVCCLRINMLIAQRWGRMDVEASAVVVTGEYAHTFKYATRVSVDTETKPSEDATS